MLTWNHKIDNISNPLNQRDRLYIYKVKNICS